MIPVLTQRPAICLAKETATVSFPVMAVDVYGMSPTNLANVKKLLDELVKEECISKDVQSSHIMNIPETDKKAIVTLSRANQISILVTSSEKLTVSGKRDDVLDAVLKINGFIQEARDREMREGEVKRLRETLCWEVARGERWESLEPSISYDIEMAFHRKEKSFQYQENRETYTVDFNQMEVTNSKQESCRIKRTLLGDSDTGIDHNLQEVQRFFIRIKSISVESFLIPFCRLHFHPCSNTSACNYQVNLKTLISWCRCV